MAACGGQQPASRPAARNLLLITIDTLRADHVRRLRMVARPYQHPGMRWRRMGPCFEPRLCGGADHAHLTRHAAERPLSRRVMARATTVCGCRLTYRRWRPNCAPKASRQRRLSPPSRSNHQFRPESRLRRLRRPPCRAAPAAGLPTSGPAADGRQPTAICLAVDDERRTTNVECGRGPFFLWVHLFEPHAPYGDPSNRSRPGAGALRRGDRDPSGPRGRPVDRRAGTRGGEPRWVVAGRRSRPRRSGEHEEYAHSIFVYDTTLRQCR